MSRLVNYFRTMAGIPTEVTFVDEYNTLAQEAALIMSANQRVSHYPHQSWECWSEEGREGASASNLARGPVGLTAIAAYMRDPGPDNADVGHRRWILHPTTRQMGSGDITRGGQGQSTTNALYVNDVEHFWDPKPELRDGFIAWPPPGYVPHSFTYARWHISFDQSQNVRLFNATVSMTRDGEPIPAAIEWQGTGLRDETLVWRVDNRSDRVAFPRPPSDEVYTVTIDGVVINGVSQQVVYDVTVFDPLVTPMIPGDYNGNGRVEQGDLDLVLLNWGDSFDTLPMEWIHETPEAGIVDQLELDGILLNWGNVVSTSSAVPESSAVALFAICLSVAASFKPRIRSRSSAISV